MLKLKYTYRNTIVSIVASYLLVKRISELFDQVTMKLPDEEQFGMIGSIFIAPKEAIVNFHKKSSSHPILGRGLSTNLFIKDGNYRLWFAKDLKDSCYLITLALDTWDEKSDDCITGLIAYKISEMSYMWKVREITPELRELEKPEIMPNHRIQPIGSEEYEGNVNKEVERLGFGKELLAYDTQS